MLILKISQRWKPRLLRFNSKHGSCPVRACSFLYYPICRDVFQRIPDFFFFFLRNTFALPARLSVHVLLTSTLISCFWWQWAAHLSYTCLNLWIVFFSPLSRCFFTLGSSELSETKSSTLHHLFHETPDRLKQTNIILWELGLLYSFTNQGPNFHSGNIGYLQYHCQAGEGNRAGASINAIELSYHSKVPLFLYSVFSRLL